MKHFIIRNKKILIIAAWICVWEILYLIVNQPLFLASPLSTLSALARILITKTAWLSIANSIWRIIVGYLVALFLGGLFSVISYKYKHFAEFIAPVMTLLKSIPIASIIVLLLAWLSSKGISLFISGLVVFPIIYFQMLSVLEQTDAQILEMCKIFRVGFLKKAKYIYRPRITENIDKIIQSSIGMSIRAAIAAELIGVPKQTIGEAIYKAKLYFDISDLFAWTVIAVGLCFVLEKAFLYAVLSIKRRYQHE